MIDPNANRYFFVENPAKFKLSGKLPGEIKIRKHPQHSECGERLFHATPEIYLSENDAKIKDEFNLMGAMKPAKIEGKSVRLIEKTGSRQFVHWLPVDEKQILEAEIMMPDGSVKKGVAEANLLHEEEGAIVQLERFGFARIDSMSKANKAVRLYYTHK